MLPHPFLLFVIVAFNIANTVFDEVWRGYYFSDGGLSLIGPYTSELSKPSCGNNTVSIAFPLQLKNGFSYRFEQLPTKYAVTVQNM
jgi:hypothetical protein